jgi:hypothetical protein
MSNDSMNDALDRLMRSRGFHSSKFAFKDGSDCSYRQNIQSDIHVRLTTEKCGCEPTDNTNSEIVCSCLISAEQHRDYDFPDHPLDIKGAINHIAYDVGPYVKKKLNNYFQDD